MISSTALKYVALAEMPARLRIAALLDRALFGFLIFLICFFPLPYGSSHPWWKALLICLVLLATIFYVIENILHQSTRIDGLKVIVPVLSLALFAYLQTVPLPFSQSVSGLSIPPWTTVSADPYQTRFVALQLLALASVMLLLYRYLNSEQRIRAIIYVVIGVAVVSAVFGVVRQTVQRDLGFVLPLLKPGSGYGQFINKNHFAFLMEMALGLGVGLVVGGGVKRRLVMLYVALLIPIWTALVLSNSRGGIVAMLAQLTLAVFVFAQFRPKSGPSQSALSRIIQAPMLRLTLGIVLFLALTFGVIWVGGDRLVGNLQIAGSEFAPNRTFSTEGVTRNEIWRATLRIFAAHPVFGVGLGGYWIAITEHHKGSGTMTPQQAHNDFLELLASGGLVGFAIGAWFVRGVYKRARAVLASEDDFRKAVCLGAIVGITGPVVHSFFDFGLHLPGNTLFFVTLLSLATILRAKQSSRKNLTSNNCNQ